LTPSLEDQRDVVLELPKALIWRQRMLLAIQLSVMVV